MPFQKGNTLGRGRPRLGDSLAEQIRKALTKEHRTKLFGQMMAMACEPHGDPRARVAAAEWLAKHGWPDEARGVTTVTTEGGKTIVRHEHIND